eukprot:GSA25T00021387001.1
MLRGGKKLEEMLPTTESEEENKTTSSPKRRRTRSRKWDFLAELSEEEGDLASLSGHGGSDDFSLLSSSFDAELDEHELKEEQRLMDKYCKPQITSAVIPHPKKMVSETKQSQNKTRIQVAGSRKGIAELGNKVEGSAMTGPKGRNITKNLTFIQSKKGATGEPEEAESSTSSLSSGEYEAGEMPIPESRGTVPRSRTTLTDIKMNGSKFIITQMLGDEYKRLMLEERGEKVEVPPNKYVPRRYEYMLPSTKTLMVSEHSVLIVRKPIKRGAKEERRTPYRVYVEEDKFKTLVVKYNSEVMSVERFKRESARRAKAIAEGKRQGRRQGQKRNAEEETETRSKQGKCNQGSGRGSSATSKRSSATFLVPDNSMWLPKNTRGACGTSDKSFFSSSSSNKPFCNKEEKTLLRRGWKKRTTLLH